MSPQQNQSHPAAETRFIDYLENLSPRDLDNDPGAPARRATLATLRRGLGRPAGAVIEMYRYIGVYLPRGAKPCQEDAYFLVAALFALHPHRWSRKEDGQYHNLGASCRLLRPVDGPTDSLEKRFVALLDASSESLEHHLRHAISLMRAKEVRVNYLQLLYDIQNWSRDDRLVQRRWARAYWGGGEAVTPASPSNDTATGDTADN